MVGVGEQGVDGHRARVRPMNHSALVIDVNEYFEHLYSRAAPNKSSHQAPKGRISVAATLSFIMLSRFPKSNHTDAISCCCLRVAFISNGENHHVKL